MNLAAEILVIILSVFLAIFLVLAIVLTGYLISLTRQIRKVTNSAEKTVGDLGSVISGFAKLISPMFIAEMIAKVFNKFKKDKEKEEK
jgi:uncharacterized membrane protein